MRNTFLISVLILVGTFLMFSCDTDNGQTDADTDIEPDIEMNMEETREDRTKMDTMMRRALRQADEAEEPVRLSFFLEVNTEPTEQIKARLEETGAEIRTVSNRILTMRGYADQVRALSVLEVVKRMELAQPMHRLEGDE